MALPDCHDLELFEAAERGRATVSDGSVKTSRSLEIRAGPPGSSRLQAAEFTVGIELRGPGGSIRVAREKRYPYAVVPRPSIGWGRESVQYSSSRRAALYSTLHSPGPDPDLVGPPMLVSELDVRR